MGSASATLTYNNNPYATVAPGTFYTITGKISLGAEALDAGLYTNAGEDASSVALSAEVAGTVLTAGPVRPGYVEVPVDFPDASASGFNFFGTFATVLGSYQGTCSPVDDSESCYTLGFPSRAILIPGNVLLPIILGEPFSFDFNTSFEVANGYNDFGTADVAVNEPIEFSFVEADETTPVAFTPIPEPATYGLTLIAAFLLVTSGRYNFSSVFLSKSKLDWEMGRERKNKLLGERSL